MRASTSWTLLTVLLAATATAHAQFQEYRPLACAGGSAPQCRDAPCASARCAAGTACKNVWCPAQPGAACTYECVPLVGQRRRLPQREGRPAAGSGDSSGDSSSNSTSRGAASSSADNTCPPGLDAVKCPQMCGNTTTCSDPNMVCMEDHCGSCTASCYAKADVQATVTGYEDTVSLLASVRNSGGGLQQVLASKSLTQMINDIASKITNQVFNRVNRGGRPGSLGPFSTQINSIISQLVPGSLFGGNFDCPQPLPVCPTTPVCTDTCKAGETCQVDPCTCQGICAAGAATKPALTKPTLQQQPSQPTVTGGAVLTYVGQPASKTGCAGKHQRLFDCLTKRGALLTSVSGSAGGPDLLQLEPRLGASRSSYRSCWEDMIAGGYGLQGPEAAGDMAMLNQTFSLTTAAAKTASPVQYTAVVSKAPTPSSVVVGIYRKSAGLPGPTAKPECSMTFTVSNGYVLGTGQLGSKGPATCPDGTMASTVAGSAATACVPCEVGYYSTRGKACTPCVTPAYAPARGCGSCSVCPANTQPNLDAGGYSCVPIL